MKIAILGARGIPARYGGFETFAEKLGVGLCARGVDVTVFCESSATGAAEFLEEVRLQYISVPKLGPLQTIFYDLKCLWAARKDYDVVYMLGYGAALFCFLPRLWGTQVWINPDGLEWARAKWGFAARLYFRAMEWTSLRVADRMIVDSEALVPILAKRHGKLPAYSVIEYGCEVIDRAPPVQPLSEWGLSATNYYLVVCRLEPENHVLEVLKGFLRSSSKKTMVVVGNNRSQSSYVQELNSIRDPRIQMIGTVYDADKLTCLRYYSFAYMHGHSVGGTNPSLLESMGCGNLILAHDNPFNRATMGDCGLYFSDPVELAKTIDEIEVYPEGLEVYRNGAKHRARSQFCWADIVGRYAELMQEVLQSPIVAEEVLQASGK